MLSIIGDVHGKLDRYFEIARKSEYSLQIGDFGFGREWQKLHYSGLDPDKHKVIPGNHDDYDVCLGSNHCLGDFGLVEFGGFKFFFIRGGYSIDCAPRREEKPKTWWSKEQLTYSQMRECEELFIQTKPDMVITHTPPNTLINVLGSQRIMDSYGYDRHFQCVPSQFVEYLFNKHQPKLWIFGHMHTSFADEINGCSFIGLAELEVINL